MSRKAGKRIPEPISESSVLRRAEADGEREGKKPKLPERSPILEFTGSDFSGGEPHNFV